MAFFSIGILANLVLFSTITVFINWAILNNKITLKRVGINIVFLNFIFIMIRLVLPININFPISLTLPYPLLVQIADTFGKTMFYNYSIKFIFTLFWIILFIVLFFQLIYKYFRIVRYIHILNFHQTTNQTITELTKNLAKEYNIKREINLIISNNVHQPFMFGILHPTIIIPERNYSINDLTCILTHEIHHIKYKDSSWKLCFSILRTLYWWLPTVYILDKQLSEYLEIRCDYKCIDALINIDKIEYLECLLKEARYSSAKRNTSSMIMAVVTDKSFLKKRFDLILEDTPINKKYRKYIKTLIIVIFICSLSIIFLPAKH